MIKVLKKYLKLIIGTFAILLVLTGFFVAMRSDGNLEDGNLKNWAAASNARRDAAVTILMGGTGDMVVARECIDKMSAMPDSGTVSVRDAASLCALAMALNPNEKQ
ncbi:MAG: hypothetical protein LBR41_03670 [Rickettsiales bacterium]|nr:hypothetical protein [Rickettsiales bacterium]